MVPPPRGIFGAGPGRAPAGSGITAPTQPDSKAPKVLGQGRIAHKHQPFAAAPRLIEPQDYQCRRNKMVAATPPFTPPAVAVPPGSAPVLSQLQRHRRPGGPVQDLGKAAGAREQDAETDQNLRPTGQAHPGSRERENMGSEKQARELERGLEIELQGGRSRHERSSSPLPGSNAFENQGSVGPPAPKRVRQGGAQRHP